MSYDFFLPCTPEKATPVSIYEDGEIVFHDTSVIEEVETALAAIELGFEMPEEVSLCTEAFFMWRDNPRRFICASNLFPVMTIGYVSCAWADAAQQISSELDGILPESLPIIEQASERAYRYFLGQRVHYRRILDDRRALKNLDFDYRTLKVDRNYWIAEFSSGPAALGLKAVLSCLDTIVDITDQEVVYGRVRDEIDQICQPGLILETLCGITGEDAAEETRAVAAQALSMYQEMTRRGR